MPYTTCPYCNKFLYSAADKSPWICPYCKKGKDKDEKEEKDTKEQVE